MGLEGEGSSDQANKDEDIDAPVLAPRGHGATVGTCMSCTGTAFLFAASLFGSLLSLLSTFTFKPSQRDGD